jgi:hypothetical protein
MHRWSTSALLVLLSSFLGLIGSIYAVNSFVRQDSLSRESSQKKDVIFGRTREIDLGTVLRDNTATEAVSVPLINPTVRTLRIDKVETSCGCLDAEVIPSVVEPGGKADLRFNLRLGERDVQKLVRLRFLSSSHGPWEVLAKGQYICKAHWEPHEIYLGPLDPGQGRVIRSILYLARPSEHSPQKPVLGLDPSDKERVQSFGLEVSEGLTNGYAIDQYELVLELRPAENDQFAKGKVWVNDQSGGKEALAELNLSWSAQQPLVVYPDSVGFTGLGEQKRNLIIASNDGLPFKILKCRCELKGLDILVTEPQPSPSQKVSLFFRPPKESPGQREGRSFNGPLSIDVEHPKVKSLTVSLSWFRD